MTPVGVLILYRPIDDWTDDDRERIVLVLSSIANDLGKKATWYKDATTFEIMITTPEEDQEVNLN